MVTRAREMPPARSAVRLAPSPETITENTSIMPTTVPSRPISGVMAAMVPSGLRKRSMSWITAVAASVRRALTCSCPRRALRSPAASTPPSGEWLSSQ